ncbi:MAG: hypothetical protein ACI4AQ_04280 [Lachnospiraceae bacterium]
MKDLKKILRNMVKLIETRESECKWPPQCSTIFYVPKRVVKKKTTDMERQMMKSKNE